MAAMAVSAAQSQDMIEKTQANFTKQLEAMQTLMNQTLDTRLNSLSEALILENKEIKSQTEQTLAALRQDINQVQQHVKNSPRGGEKSPRPSIMRSDSTMSMNLQSKQTNEINTVVAQVKRLEDSVQALERN